MGELIQTTIQYARNHGGVVTRSEALAIGVPSTTLKRMVRQGILTRVGNGVYSLPGVDNDHLLTLHAACRKLGAVVSHESAALIHGLDKPRSVKPSVSVPRRRTYVFEGVMVHQLTDLTDEHIEDVKGLPTTTPERTVVDLAAIISERHLERIVDHGLASGALHAGRLSDVFGTIGRQGKPGTAKMRKILESRKPGYTAPESELERRLLKLFSDYGLPEPIPQFRAPWLSPTRGRVDFAYPDSKLVIEGDSRRWHTMLNSFEIDRLRDNAAQLAGWRILRFTWDEINESPARVADTVNKALKMR